MAEEKLIRFQFHTKIEGGKKFYYYEFDEYDGNGEFPLLGNFNKILKKIK